MKKIFLSAAMLAMFATGCQNEVLVQQESNEGGQLMTLVVNRGMESRTHLGTTDATTGKTPTYWSEGDEIYVSGKSGKVTGVLKLKNGMNSAEGTFEGYVFGGNVNDLQHIVFPVPVGGKTINMADRTSGKLDAPMVGTISFNNGETTASLSNVGGIIAFKSDKEYGVRAMNNGKNMAAGTYTFNPGNGTLTYVPGTLNDITSTYKSTDNSGLVYVPVATAYVDNNGTTQSVTSVNVEVLDGKAVVSSGEMEVKPSDIVGDEEHESALPEISAWDGTSIKREWYDNHTSDKIFYINEAAELAYLAQLVNTNTQPFKRKKILLNANIDLNDKLWTPIGDANDEDGNFKGIFDGQNHTISNLRVNVTDGGGLFGFIGQNEDSGYETTIENLKVNNVDIVSTKNAGGIVGYARRLNINNCEVDGGKIQLNFTKEEVEGKVIYKKAVYAGGVIGWIQLTRLSNAAVEGCTARNLTIRGYSALGGIAGHVQGFKGENVNFTNNKVFNVKLYADRTLEDNYGEDRAANIDKIVGYKNKITIDETNTSDDKTTCEVIEKK